MKRVECVLPVYNYCGDWCSQFVEPERIEGYAANFNVGAAYINVQLCQSAHVCDADEFVDERPTDG